MVAALAVTGTAQAATPRCGELFGETTWDIVEDGAVRIETSSVSPAVAARYRNEISIVTGWVTDEVGPVEVTICLVDETSGFDRDRFRNGSQLFHAVSDLKERYIAMDTRRQVNLVGPAMAFAIPQHALFQNNGEEAFPVPLADAIAYWYRARLVERLPYYERQQRGANLFETESRIDWTEGGQPMFRSWDPDGNDGSIGAFIDFAVKLRGSEILLETDGDVWKGLESDWRRQLRIDLTGSDSPSTGWRGGALMVVVVVVVGTVMAGYGIYRSRRKTQRPETPQAIPGFFDGQRPKDRAS
jgi:hypothetical protein